MIPKQSPEAEKRKIDWTKVLKSYVEAHPSTRSMREIEDETDMLFLKYIDEANNARKKDNESYKKIPMFYKKSADDEIMQQIAHKVKQEARTRFLHHKTSEILEKEDLEKLWLNLRENISPPEDGKERINYDSFLKIAGLLPPKCRHFFSASAFLKFDRDEYGRIDILSFFHSIVRKVSLLQTRIQISLYDSIGNGYLREKDLENYIFELIPTFPLLSELQKNYYTFYVITAVRKFFFFLDPKRTGKVFIKDLLTSPILAELYDLRQEVASEEISMNWFSYQSVMRVYNAYLRLDVDMNGLLKKEELEKLQWGITPIVIDRIYEEYQTFEGEIDYKTYLDFVLAIENRKTNQSLQYFWRILDIHGKGGLDSFTINVFFKEILGKLATKDPEAEKNFKIEDVKDEIFDMAKPKSPHCITLEDLIASGIGDIVVGILIDAKLFYDYDQRESQNMLDPDEEGYINHSYQFMMMQQGAMVQ